MRTTALANCLLMADIIAEWLRRNEANALIRAGCGSILRCHHRALQVIGGDVGADRCYKLTGSIDASMICCLVDYSSTLCAADAQTLDACLRTQKELKPSLITHAELLFKVGLPRCFGAEYVSVNVTGHSEWWCKVRVRQRRAVPVHVAPPIALIHVLPGGSARGAEERLPSQPPPLCCNSDVVDTRRGKTLELMTGRRVTWLSDNPSVSVCVSLTTSGEKSPYCKDVRTDPGDLPVSVGLLAYQQWTWWEKVRTSTHSTLTRMPSFSKHWQA